MSREWVTVADALAVRDGMTLIVEVRGIRYGVPRHYIARDSEVRQPGQRGTLLVLRRFAEDAGLVPQRATPSPSASVQASDAAALRPIRR